MRKVRYLIISIVEIPFIILTYIDYLWNSLIKNLCNISFIFAIPSIITMPITWMNGLILATLIYIKHNVIGRGTTFKEAVFINLDRFSEP